MTTLTDRHNAIVIDQFTHQAKPFAEAPIHSAADSLEYLQRLSGAGSEDEVLDVACGTGIVSCALAGIARRVEGIDLVPAMLEQARQLQSAKGLSNVSWREGNVAKLPYADNSFSLVITRYTFHHFAEPGAVIREMARVCKPGGRVVIADVTQPAEKREAFDQMEKLRDASHASAFTPEELEELGRGTGVRLRQKGSYEVDTALESLLRDSHTPGADQARIQQMVGEDIGVDRLGIKAYRDAEGLRFRFPISIFVWEKPETHC